MPVESLMKSATTQSALTGFLGGAAGGAVVSALTNKKSAKKLLKTGGLVAIGGVAWHAFQQFRDNSEQANGTHGAPAPSAALTPPQQILQSASPAAAPQGEDQTGLLLSAMIAAAYADGHLTESEQTKVWQRAVDEGLSGDALTQLEQALAQPPAMEDIVAATIGMDSKMQVYAASLVALDEGCAAGKAYLAELAQRLSLPQPLVTAIHANAA